MLAIIIREGVVVDLVTDDPGQLGTRFMTVDYDIEGCDDGDVTAIKSLRHNVDTDLRNAVTVIQCLVDRLSDYHAEGLTPLVSSARSTLTDLAETIESGRARIPLRFAPVPERKAIVRLHDVENMADIDLGAVQQAVLRGKSWEQR
jgi:hypothetical protein